MCFLACSTLSRLCKSVSARFSVPRGGEGVASDEHKSLRLTNFKIRLCVSGETPHRCDFCSKAFTRKEHLLNHVRQHTGESPHRCGYCSKSFTRKEHLINHVRQHTGETPFRCQYCPKAFTRKDHLVNHVRQHTGETPHKCQ